MRWRPNENDQELQDRFKIDRAGHRHIANHGRKRARGTADDDVLSRPMFEPHRVNDDVEENRKRQKACRIPIRNQA